MNGEIDMDTEAVNLESKATPSLIFSLWSIRHLLRSQPVQAFKLIQTWNFSKVEVNVFLDMRAPDLNDMLREHQLQAHGLAGPPLKLIREPRYYIDWAKEYLPIFDTRILILQSRIKIFPEKTENQWKKNRDQIVDLIIEVAKYLEKDDIRVSYHCYPFDFKLIEGQSLVSRLFDREDLPENIGLQLDTYWLHYGQIKTDVFSSLRIHSICTAQHY